MKILVTGGAGFIGSHIVDAYINAGHSVLIVDNLSSGKVEQINPKAEFKKADITDSKISEIISSFKPEIINHQAAQIEVRTSVENPTLDAKINILGSLNLLEAARNVGSVKKFIFASSGGATYGEAEIVPTTEIYPTRPISPYGVAKLSVEHYLYYYKAVYGLNYIALRYANVYGPRQNPHGEAGVVAIFYQRMLSKKGFVINGDGEQTRDFVFVEDVAHANLASLNCDYVGPINVGTSIETSINTLVENMVGSLGINTHIAHGEAKAGEQKRSCLSYDLAQEKLSWNPQVSLTDGLAKTAGFFKSNI